MIRLYHADFTDWLRGNLWAVQNGFMPRYHGTIQDPPYFLDSIAKRFGKKNSAPAKQGKDGSFKRLGKGFMEQEWDSFSDVYHYQDWVTEWASLQLNFMYPGALGAWYGGARTHHRIAAGLEDAGWEIVTTLMYLYGSGMVTGHYADEDNCFNTALKPAYEPIIIARAPRDRTYSALHEDFGTGCFNIGSNRVNERYPANVAFDDIAAEMLDEQSGTRPGGGSKTGDEPSSQTKHVYGNSNRKPFEGYEDTGGASRFFYTAKAPTWERDAGLAQPNNHPTVKPILLNQWLARLLLPPRHIQNPRLLNAFTGTGSEAIGATLAGWKHIDCIEKTDSYIPLAQVRLDWWARFKSHAQAESAYAGEQNDNRLEENGQLSLF